MNIDASISFTRAFRCEACRCTVRGRTERLQVTGEDVADFCVKAAIAIQDSTPRRCPACKRKGA